MPSIRSLFLSSALLFSAVLAQGVDHGPWSFSGGQAVISLKGQTARVTEDFTPKQPLPELSLRDHESLRLALTLRHADGPARPHQAFVLLKDPASQLETYFPLTVKGTSGKAKVEIPTSKIPPVLLASSQPLELNLILGSFGQEEYPATILLGHVKPTLESPPTYTPPVRYEAKDEIHHVFNADAKSPPKILTLVFLGAVLASLGGLFIAWALAGANLNGLGKSMKAAPASNALFVGSIVALEGTFAMYYLSWNLFKTLGVAAGIAVVAVLSGRGALRDARVRRLAGQGR